MARKRMADRYASAGSSKKSPKRKTLPRLSDSSGENVPPDNGTSGLNRASGLSSRRAAMTVPKSTVDFTYVAQDLRRILITAVAMLILMIVLNIVLQSLLH